MGKRKAKTKVTELEAILRFCESRPIGGNAISTRCRQIREAVKAAAAEAAAVAAFRLAESLFFAQRALDLMAELRRVKGHNAVTVLRQSEAAARRARARELALAVPKNNEPKRKTKARIAIARELKIGTEAVRKYLQGIHSSQG